MNEHMSPEFEERLHDLLAAPDADAVFVGSLRSKLIERSKVKTFHRFSPRLVWGIAIVLVLLIIGLLVFSPQVVEAMRRLLGYIPGVGYVEQGPALRVLSAPVTVQKDGLTVTIEKGAADSHHGFVDGGHAAAHLGRHGSGGRPRLITPLNQVAVLLAELFLAGVEGL